MNAVIPSICHHAHRTVAWLALVAGAWCVLALLAYAVLVLAGHVPPPAEGPLLAPARWTPVVSNIA